MHPSPHKTSQSEPRTHLVLHPLRLQLPADCSLGLEAPLPVSQNLKLFLVCFQCMDAFSPQEYSLEEAKQKAEQDALEAAAEAKKMGVRGCAFERRAQGGRGHNMWGWCVSAAA
jgi:hypothetical protein